MVLLYALIVLLATSCFSVRVGDQHLLRLAWDELEENPEAYEGRRVALCGWFRAEFEVCTLEPSQYGDPALATVRAIWLAPKADVCTLDKVVTEPTRVWADVSGIFQYSRNPAQGFGHFELNRSMIRDAEVSVRATSCDE